MSVEAFSNWFSGQSATVQDLVLFGPPFLVMCVIGLTLGARFRFLRLAWRFGPTLATGVEALTRPEDPGADDWKDDADDAIDDAVARQRDLHRRL